MYIETNENIYNLSQSSGQYQGLDDYSDKKQDIQQIQADSCG